jgi:predicted nuclease of restriction endonuclease-like (RecB) superfamily
LVTDQNSGGEIKAKDDLEHSVSYSQLLTDLKLRIRTAQTRAAFAVSRELVFLYWSIGRDILSRQQAEGWGAKIIDRLAHDLQNEFPGTEGFSPRNLKYMRSLAEAWPEPEKVPQLVALLPWGHLRVLLDRIKDRPTREWYLRSAVEYGWSRNVLVHQIESRLHERQGKALSNFSRTLPPGDSDLAEQILKDPYNFDFLTLRASAQGKGTRTRPTPSPSRSVAGTWPGLCLRR